MVSRMGNKSGRPTLHNVCKNTEMMDKITAVVYLQFIFVFEYHYLDMSVYIYIEGFFLTLLLNYEFVIL